MAGGFTSVQVNVDANGSNILGDAANEPSIAIDPLNPSRIVIGWRQFDTVTSNFRQAGWAYSHDGGKTWTFPGVLEPGVFRSDPVLGADQQGYIYYLSLSVSGGFTCQLFRSTDGGVSWDPPVFAYGGDKAWMAIDRTEGIGKGNIYEDWGSSSYPPFTRSTDGGQSFMSPINPACSTFAGTMDVGPGGELYLVGGTSSFCRSLNAQDPAQTPTFELSQAVNLKIAGPSCSAQPGGSPNPGGLVGQLWVATDHSQGPTRGFIYMLKSIKNNGTNDPLDVMLARSEDGGVTWKPPVKVNDDPPSTCGWQWFGTMSVAPNGRIDVVWNDTRNTGQSNLCELHYSHSFDAGQTWAANVAVSPVWDSWVGWPNQNKIGDYYHMISDDVGANLAYAATFNGEQDVYFLKITVDCDANGAADKAEIAASPSLDCNGNEVIDFCDIAGGASPDCNANGTPDECDLAASSPSPDINGNAVPDECEYNQAVDLAIAKTVAPTAPVQLGEDLTYTLTVANEGSGLSSNAFLVDSLPAGLSFVSVQASKGSCQGENPVVCDFGPLLPGESATAVLVAKAGAAGEILNTALVTLDPPLGTGEVTLNPAELSLGNNSASASSTVLGPPEDTSSGNHGGLCGMVGLEGLLLWAVAHLLLRTRRPKMTDLS